MIETYCTYLRRYTYMNIFKFSLESRSSKAGWFFKKKVVYIYNIVIFDLHSLCQFRIRIYGVTHWKRIKWRTKIYKRKIFLRNLISWPPSYTALLVEMEMDRNCLNIKQPSALFFTIMLSRAQQIQRFLIQNTVFTGCQLYFVKFVY